MMYGYGGQWGVLGWVVMGLVMLLFWGGVVTAVVLLLRRRSDGDVPRPRGIEDAERILNERFARGEIDEQEFTARRAALRRSE
ncbi:SHOCT domain-containing protein [Lacisediminihabitans sp.]|jgi:putative membrane protein|uniref:SHOCT domain-containing protein n=1 Tax=Lacisediminihabitans sp. TaxID=2787631 RepID=UPI002F95FA5F